MALLRGAGILAALFLPGPAALRAQPAVNHLYPAAARQGATTPVTAVGKFTAWPPTVWVDAPGITFRPATNSGKFDVSVAPDATTRGPSSTQSRSQSRVSDCVISPPASGPAPSASLTLPRGFGSTAHCGGSGGSDAPSVALVAAAPSVFPTAISTSRSSGWRTATRR